MGIEPTYPAWKAGVLPLNYTRIFNCSQVGVTGFEPATSWSQTRRSSQAEPHPASNYSTYLQNHTLKIYSSVTTCGFCRSLIPYWSSPRPISDSQLHALPRFHLCPIYLVVFKGSYYLRMGYLILRGASRLDAFSVYPVPAWLLCHAPGGTTDQPAASPSRSSRTKDSSSQISYAHAG